jgi:hypothetical protein
MGQVTDWRVGFDYVWRNSHNFERIIEGGHWGGPKKNESAPRRAGTMYEPFKGPREVDLNSILNPGG